MIVAQLDQKSLLSKRHYVITDKELKITSTDYLIKKEIQSFYLHEIHDQFKYHKSYISQSAQLGCMLIPLLCAIIIFVIPLLFKGALIFLLFCTIVFCMLWFLGNHYFEIRTHNPKERIHIPVNDKNRKEVAQFLDLLKTQIHLHYRDKYFKIDLDIDAQLQFLNYRGLFINDMITASEYENIKLKLKRKLKLPHNNDE